MGLTDAYITNEAKLWLIEDLLIIACGKDLGVKLSDADFYADLESLVKDWGFNDADTAIESYGKEYLRNLVYKERAYPAIKSAIKIVSDYDTYKHLYDKHSDK
jgi:hypothetical protein